MANLTADEIKGMIANEEHESRSLDFKERLPGLTDSEKVEFLCDVAALANAGGGRLLFGIEEKRDANGQPTGVAEAAPGVADVNPDKVQLSLEQVLQRGVEPRIPGCRFYPVAGVGKNPVLVLEVPRSWLAPHMVCRDEKQLFYSRHGSGKYRLDVAEIRAAFLASEGVETKMRRFRDERLGRVVAEETPVPLFPGPRLVLHLLPFRSFANPELLAPKQLLAAFNDFRPNDSCSEYRLNLDGLLLPRPPTDVGHRAYVQVFRTGAVESVIADIKTTEQGVACIRPRPLEDKVVRPLLTRQLKGLESLGVQPPVVLSGALLGARGLHLYLPSEDQEPQPSPIDRDVAVFPEELLETLPASAIEPVRHLFDALLLAGGCLRE